MVVLPTLLTAKRVASNAAPELAATENVLPFQEPDTYMNLMLV